MLEWFRAENMFTPSSLHRTQLCLRGGCSPLAVTLFVGDLHLQSRAKIATKFTIKELDRALAQGEAYDASMCRSWILGSCSKKSWNDLKKSIYIIGNSSNQRIHSLFSKNVFEIHLRILPHSPCGKPLSIWSRCSPPQQLFGEACPPPWRHLRVPSNHYPQISTDPSCYHCSANQRLVPLDFFLLELASVCRPKVWRMALVPDLM